MTRAGRLRWGARVALATLASLALLAGLGVSAGAVPQAPTGLTPIAFDGKVTLAWQPVSGASEYRVYRGTSAGAVNTLVSPAGLTATTFTDTSATNAQSGYYVVRAVDGSGASAPSAVVLAQPRAASCSSGNAVVVENCFPGTSAWKTTAPARAPGGIEGFATRTSIDAGQSVGLKVNAADGAPYHVEIYRTGWYGGSEGRLIGRLEGLTATAQPDCVQPTDGLGLIDCSNWSTTSTLSTTASWPSGAYLLRLVRDDNGSDSHILLVVRHDAGHEGVVYQVPVTSYQAYNNYAGRSLYDWNSYLSTTVAGTSRAVEVSFDRPYAQVVNGERDWYPLSDIQNVAWLERQGYDMSYVTSVDVQSPAASLTNHGVFVSPSHDEYWSAEMRSRVTNARDAGVDLAWLGSNNVYWKIRFIASPVSGTADRVVVCYKSTQSGPADPSGIPTGTWRDPAGANQPENALLGTQYVGDNDTDYFPLVVSAAEGKNPAWRGTGLDTQASGASARVGQYLVGWEWNARVANGKEPAGLQVLASSPATGELLTDAGKTYASGSTTTQATEYRAASGALVFTSGTNHWSRGLGLNMDGVGEPNSIIQQATLNILADMGATATTPSGSVTPPPAVPPTVTSTSPASGATGVSTATKVTATFDRSLDASTVTTSSVTLAPSGGAPVSATVAYDDATHTVTLTPSAALTATTTYTATLSTAIHGADGTPLASAVTWSFTTAGPFAVTSQVPASGATGISRATNVRAVFSRAADPATITTSTFRLRTGLFNLTSVTATVSYDAATRTAILTPSQLLSAGTSYTASLTTGVRATDGTPLPATVTWSFTTASAATPAPTVTSTSPAAGATGVAPGTTVKATFAIAMDAATIDTRSFTLASADGSPVAGGVAYDGTSRTATLTPSAPLAGGATYTARLTTAIRSSTGQPMQSDVTWQFTIADPCPCTLMSALTPVSTGNSTQDGRTGTGPWSYELGTKIRVSQPLQLTALRFYKSPGETGTHVGRVWSASGTQLASVTYAGETASGWQRQALATPLSLAANTTYVVSYNANAAFVSTTSGLATALTNGPLSSVADGANGVFGASAGTFPTSSWSSSNYFADAEVRSPGSQTQAPQVTSTSPASGATGVSRTTSVTATFDVALDAATVNATTFTLKTPAGTTVAASVSYDGTTRTAKLTPSSALDASTQYTATLTTGIHAGDGTPLAAAVTWSFTTAAATASPPTVTSTSPTSGATQISPATTVRATFDQAMTASTIDGSTFTLTGPGAAVAATVAYDATTQTATLTPTVGLAPSTAYTATVTTGAKSSGGTGLAADVTWSFTTSACPCQLFADTATPTGTGFSTQDGRTGSGPFTYELGVKVRVGQPASLTAIRFYKSPGETGTHVGRLWTAAGTQVATVTFAGETSSGWQQQAMATPVALTPGQVYVVSVGANAYFSSTQQGLASAITSGPLSSVADGANGVFGSAAGTFPTSSWNSSNYFVDAVVR